MGEGESGGCGRLPLPLEKCKTCGGGIGHIRGWRWIKPRILFGEGGCEQTAICATCPAGLAAPERAGLLWIGKAFYPNPADFTNEATVLGVSRRIFAVPRGFVAGETWVYLAHLRAIQHMGETPEDTTFSPGVFTAFRPSRVEYVVKATDAEEKLEKLEKRGIRLVDVKHAGEEAPLPLGGDDAGPSDPDEAVA
jgi:hypothetical protein